MQTANQTKTAKEILKYAYELLVDERAVPRNVEFTEEQELRARFAADCMREDANRKAKRHPFMF